MKKKNLILILCALTVLLVFAGCSGRRSAAPGAKTELTLWIGSWWEPSAERIKTAVIPLEPIYSALS